MIWVIAKVANRRLCTTFGNAPSDVDSLQAKESFLGIESEAWTGAPPAGGSASSGELSANAILSLRLQLMQCAARKARRKQIAHWDMRHRADISCRIRRQHAGKYTLQHLHMHRCPLSFNASPRLFPAPETRTKRTTSHEGPSSACSMSKVNCR